MKKLILLASLMLAFGTITGCSDDDNGDSDPTDPTDVIDGDTSPDTDTDGDTTLPDTAEPTCLDFGDEPGIGEEVEGTDSDEDGVCDSAEPSECVGSTDCDEDGLSDAAEIFYNDPSVGGRGFATDPRNADTDDNGSTDLEDIESGNNPVSILDDITDNDPAFDGTAYSYVSGLGIASESCCYDLNDQIGADNSLAALLEGLGSALGSFGDIGIDLSAEGIAALLQGLLDEGDLALVLEHNSIPDDLENGARDDAQISFWLANIVLDEEEGVCETAADCTSGPAESTAICSGFEEGTDGGDDTLGDCVYLNASVEERANGNGEYPLESQIGEGSEEGPVTLDALIGFNEIIVNEGDLVLALDLEALAGDAIADLGLPSTLELTISKARLGGALEEQTGSQPAQGDETTIGVASDGQLDLGGAVGIGQVVDLLNDLLDPCFQNPSGGGDLIQIDTESNESRVALTCADPFPDTSNSQQGLCTTLNDLPIGFDAICGLLDQLIGSNLDVDTNDSGKADGLSLGLKLQLSGASNSYEVMSMEPVIAE
jgi:hypothetical protein